MIISVGNIYSRVVECTPEEYLAFRDALTFETPNYWFSKAYKEGVWDGKKRFFRDKSFPTGLLFLIKEAIPRVNYRVPKGSPINLNPTILKTKHLTGKFSYQFDSLKAMFEHRRGILDNATGAGKTVIASAFFEHLRKPSLFVVHTKELLEQSYQVFTTETSLPVGKFGAGQDTRELLTVGMVQTLARRLKDYQTRKWLASLDAVIMDEAHLASAKSYTDILKKCPNAKYRIGISGTPLDRTQLDNLQLQAYLGPVIHSIRNDALIEAGVNAVPEVEMIRYFHSSSYDKRVDKYADIYTKMIVENQERNLIIVKETLKALTGSNKALVLVHRQNHGFILQKLFSEHNTIVSFCYGESTDEERKREFEAIKNGNSQVLIASKIAEVGLDIPQLSVMIRASAGKSTVSTLQAIGRLLRNPWHKGATVKYIDFFDDDGEDEDGNPNWLLFHSMQRRNDYGKEKFSVMERSV